MSCSGLPSTGLHTNGYSLARKLLFDIAQHLPETFVEKLHATVADELLKVHRSYLRPLMALMDARVLKGAAHITGGGITENTPRMLPKGLAAEIQDGFVAGAADFRFSARGGQRPGGGPPAHLQSRDRHDRGGCRAAGGAKRRRSSRTWASPASASGA